MERVFIMMHGHEFDDGHEDLKMVSAFSTREKAKAAVSQLRTEPRFCDHPDGFHVEAYELDAHDWPKGSSPSTSRVLLQALPPNKTMQMTAAGLRCAEALHDTNLGSIARGRR